MRVASVAVLFLALAACPDPDDCDGGTVRCDGSRLQTCLDPEGGADPRWHTVVDCSHKGLFGLPVGGCYLCQDGTSLCADDDTSACSEHGGPVGVVPTGGESADD